MGHLEDNELLTDKQFAYRQKISTITAAHKIFDCLVSGLDEKYKIAGIFCDLSKAFDVINHELLLDKLYHYGIQGKSHKLLTSFLSDRKQVVKLSSNGKRLESVPGSVNLGNTLFLLYINDLPTAITAGLSVLFADDTTVIVSARTYEQLGQRIDEGCEQLQRWFSSNELLLNITKSNIMVFSGRGLTVPPCVASNPMPICNESRFLGFTLDSNLNWKCQKLKCQKIDRERTGIKTSDNRELCMRRLKQMLSEARNDNGGEYNYKRVRDLLEQSGIKQRLITPYTLEQNGSSERENRTIVESARAMMHAHEELPQNLWAEMHLYYVCDKVIVRNFRSRRFVPQNPGLQNRLKAFREDGIKIDDGDAEEYVEQSESDFYKVGDVYNEHVNETLMGKHELRHQIIKEKYFKENMPNLLTWSEKEQIRHLATMHPDEWTPERIAESFPITVPVAKKLLKYVWKPASQARIARHDESALRNWKELKEGHLDIPEDLRRHFLKFSERKIPSLSKKSLKIDITREEKLGEFERIIQRCAAREESLKDTAAVETDPEMPKCNERKKKDSKRVTLDDLTAKIQQRLNKGNEIDLPDTMMLDMVTTEPVKVNNNQADSHHEVDLFTGDSKAELTEFKPTENNVIKIDYTKRIRIPKKAYKKGATYKIDDCYYDDDGKFLYRVLGMTN
ncbi:uncharacterized protein LOC113234846 [Hyposmocoma kahamanoa]|uniref:uncharacterized protein LOC113234846 n=1 Tax=Hyposmocoma kahamanoa TaxID=1477025 RepID=UPI000E6D7C68|nr:uncharacterized protein LOC113234846 [Hyposmocoma kahamanoa]